MRKAPAEPQPRLARENLRSSLPLLRLLDRDGSFLELSPLAAHGQYDGECPGGGCIIGVGHVEGRLCMVSANDTRVKGGAIYPLGVD